MYFTALKYGHTSVAELLINNGADLNTKAGTPLQSDIILNLKIKLIYKIGLIKASDRGFFSLAEANMHARTPLYIGKIFQVNKIINSHILIIISFL